MNHWCVSVAVAHLKQLVHADVVLVEAVLEAVLVQVQVLGGSVSPLYNHNHHHLIYGCIHGIVMVMHQLSEVLRLQGIVQTLGLSCLML